MISNEIVQAAGFLLITGSSQHSTPQQFLLMRHPDRWDLPKGHGEPGESLIQTALRETAEETGIKSSEIEIIPGFSYSLQYAVTYQSPTPKSINKRTTYFLGRLPAAVEIRCTEHEGYRWFTWSPPHQIQSQTIDELLAAVETFLNKVPQQ
jgi:bis(5'-nucleosidyl)-tetraphosphatase